MVLWSIDFGTFKIPVFVSCQLISFFGMWCPWSTDSRQLLHYKGWDQFSRNSKFRGKPPHIIRKWPCQHKSILVLRLVSEEWRYWKNICGSRRYRTVCICNSLYLQQQTVFAKLDRSLGIENRFHKSRLWRIWISVRSRNRILKHIYGKSSNSGMCCWRSSSQKFKMSLRTLLH